VTYDLRLVAYEPNGSRLGVLHEPLQFNCSSPLNDISSLMLKYSKLAQGADLLDEWVELAVERSTGEDWEEVPNGRFLKIIWSGSHLDETKALDLTIPGYAWLLTTAGVRDHPSPDSSNTDSDGKRKFSAANAGIILATLIQEAQDRDALAGLAVDFDTSLDSDGNAWDKVLTIAYEPGLTLDMILNNLADQGVVDWQMQGRTLRVFNADTTLAVDRTDQINAVVLRSGIDVVAAPDQGDSSGLLHSALVRGEGGVKVEVTNPSAPQPWGKFEATINQGGVSDTTTMTLLAQAALADGAEEQIQMTRDLSFAGARFLPFVDYWPGDYIYAPGKDGERDKLRVRQVTLSRDEDGIVTGNAVLNDRFIEATIRQAKRTRGIVGGSKSDGGSGALPADPAQADARIPAAPTGLVVETDAYIDDNGIPTGAIQATWDEVDTATDATALEISGYELWGRINASGQLWRMLTATDQVEVGYSPLEPGVEWQFKVRARGTYVLTPGQFSSTVNVTIADDTTPPPTPSTPVVTTKLGTVKVYWDGLTDVATPMPTDLSHANVHVATDGDPIASAPVVGILRPDDFMVVPDVPYDVPVEVALVAVDRAGNESGMSDVGTVTAVALVQTVDIGDDAISAPKILANSITSDKIEAGAIQAEHIAAAQITGEKIAADAIDGKTITGATIQTSALANTGIKISAFSMRAYDGSGSQTFFLSGSTGKVTATGRIQSGISGPRVIIDDDLWDGRPALQLHTGASLGSQGNFFVTEAAEGGWNAHILAITGCETTLNSSGRAQLIMEKGGDWRLEQSFGSYSGWGIIKNGPNIRFRGALHESWFADDMWRPFHATGVGPTSADASGFWSTGLWSWSLSSLPVSGTRHVVAQVGGSGGISTSSASPYVVGCQISSTGLSMRIYSLGGASSATTLSAHILAYWST